MLKDELGLDPLSPTMRRALALADNDSKFLRELRTTRMALGLSRKDVADCLGWTERQVAEFEAGDANPTLQQIRRYCHAIGVIVTHKVEPYPPASARGQG